MRSVLRRCVGVVLGLVVALPAIAATPSEFYMEMLRKGVTAYETGKLDNAAGSLKIAAFGLLESVELYQTAQVHLALTHERLGNADLSRDAARRVVVAERVETRYRSLALTAVTRSSFDLLARRVLPEAELAILTRSASAPSRLPSPDTSASSQTVVPGPATNKPPSVSSPAPTAAKTQPAVTRSEPAPVKTQPAVAKSDPTPGPAVAKPQSAPARSQSTTPGPDPAAATTQPAVAKPESGAIKSQPRTPGPAPAAVTTQPAPTKPKPAPATVNPPSTSGNSAPKGDSVPQKPQPKPQASTPARPTDPANFKAAEDALAASRLVDARAIYRRIFESSPLPRADLLRVAEGFYRSRDFANALRALERIGALRRGEEPYRYYLAVSLYETGQYARAKQELRAVLPFIELTPDVARYRVRIESSLH